MSLKVQFFIMFNEKMLTCSNVQQKHIVILILPIAAASLLPPLSIIQFSLISLVQTPSWKSPVYSDWSALTVLSKPHPLCFPINSAGVFAAVGQTVVTWAKSWWCFFWTDSSCTAEVLLKLCNPWNFSTALGKVLMLFVRLTSNVKTCWSLLCSSKRDS